MVQILNPQQETFTERGELWPRLSENSVGGREPRAACDPDVVSPKGRGRPTQDPSPALLFVQ